MMYDVEKEIAEKELGRLAMVILEGVHGTDFLNPVIGNEAILTLQCIRDILEDESKSDFACIEDIVEALWRAGISTTRHNFR